MDFIPDLIPLLVQLDDALATVLAIVNGIAGILPYLKGRSSLQGLEIRVRIIFLSGDEGDDIEHGETGNDLILGYTGNDTLFGNEGVDKLYGDQGDDILIAGSEVDELHGGDGADNLFGGTGDDLLHGDSLNNPSQDSFAGGNDFLNGEEGSDTLKGGDGTDTLLGGAHDDVLYGDAGNDVLDGGIGNDRLSGGPGADVYIIGAGSGQDIIEEAEAEDEVLANVLSSAVDIARAGNDLVITTVGTSDEFTLRSFFTSTLNQVGRVQFADGVTLDTAALMERSRLITGTEGPDILTGFENSDDILSGLGGEDLLEGLSGHDVFDGGPGNDTIYGGAGDDTYLFGRGSGTDVVQEDDFLGTDVDTIEVSAGVRPEDVTLRGLRIEGTFSRDLSLVINGTNDELRVTGFFDDPSFRIDQIKFADGTTWDEATIQSKAEAEGFHITTSSDNGVELLGTHLRDRITGGGGNDSIIGFQGNDVLKGEGGDDFLSGYEGDDALFGGAGNDTLAGDDSADQMTGGIGNDRYQVNDPGDVIIEADGEGRDVVSVESLTSYTLPGHFEDLELTTNGVVPVLIGTGNSGNNELHGNFYDNVLEGGEGNDRLWGGSANRFVGPNNDELRGGSGDDTYFFDAFSGMATIHDISVGGEGNRLQFGAGIRPGDLAFVQNGGRLEISVVSTGDLVVLADFDSSNVVGSIVTERVEFTGNLDQVVGDFQVKLADFLTPTVGTNGNDLFEGTVSVDVIRAAAGDDRLQGNAGNDVLSGGAGSDTYVFNVGDGFDLIDDQATAGETNTVVFGAGIDPQAMRLEYAGHGGALTIKVGAEGLQMMGFNSLDPLAMQPIETFQFADGTILSLSDLLVRGVDMTGTSLIPFGGLEGLGGTFADDRMAGLEGDDSLFGGAGADRLIGGRGDDVLIGGEGQDTYVFRLGDGVDKIEDAAEVFFDAADPEAPIIKDNQIQFGEGITLSDLTLVEGQDGITIRKILVGSNGDAVWVPNFADVLPGLTTAKFSDGLTVNIYNLLAAGLITEDQFIEGGGTLIGGNGNDRLTAGAGNTFLLGGNGDDILIGGSGNCSFYGGAGTNLLVGGSGGNTFVISQGSGTNTIRLPFANLLGTNTVSFGAGYSSFNPKLGFGSLLIRYGTEGGELHIEDFTPNDAYRNPGIETFQFTDRTFTYREFIELGFDLWGTGGDDVVTGTNVVDRIVGLDGNDQLNGGLGNDTLTGGHGSDLLIGGGGDDRYVFNLGDGTDTIEDTVGAGEGNRIQFGERITQTDLTFSTIGNTLTMHVGTDGDALTLRSFDPANVSGSLVVETLEFADGSTIGLTRLLGPTVTDGDDAITLGAGNDVIDARGGDDIVDAGPGNDTITGGMGNDTLIGGPGDDTYLYRTGDGNDTIQDLAALGEGNTVSFGPGILPTSVIIGMDAKGLVLNPGTPGDLLHFSHFDPTNAYASHAIDRYGFTDGTTLTYGQLIDRGFDIAGTESDDTIVGTNAIDRITGLAGNDVLQSGSGDDVLDGGDGADAMLGGSGSDTYIVDDPGDVVSELSHEGDDTVQSSLSYFLGPNVENLTLTGVAVVNGVGNELNNVILGNSAPNVLDGGAGGDTLIGGAGDDLYIVDHLSDSVIENGNEGIDSVQSSVTFSLGANVENLTLTGSAASNGVGNALDNLLTGNSAGNILDGGDGNDSLNGSGGTDTLIGGAGNDTLNGGMEADGLVGGAGDDVLQLSKDGVWSSGFANKNVGSPGHAGTGQTVALNGKNRSFDVFDGGPGTDTLRASAGDDAIALDDPLSLFPNAPGPRLTDIEYFQMGDGNDTVDLTSTLYAYGDVTLDGGNGDDTLWASAGNDVLLGGAGHDNLYGGFGADQLAGNDGNDTLDGGEGTDQLTGGLGNDVYVVDDANDLVTEVVNEGTDTVKTRLSYTLGPNVENLTLTGAAAINGTGNVLSNVLTGNSAANVLAGGLGNDTYVVGNGDTVSENVNEGTDVVQSAVSWTLGDNLETLTLTGSAAINGTGNALNNTLSGNSAANALAGGLGDDTYNVGVGDTVIEQANEGTDTIKSAITWTLDAHVENLILTGSAVIDGTGNALNNTLTGNSAVNVLAGGAGDDTYVVGAGDSVIENADGGTDTVQSAVAFTLGPYVENLTLTGSAGINGTGNAFDNVLTGNSGANVLSGGAGNDVYVIGTGDTVVEQANDGSDSVRSAVSHTLAANVENLTLTGTGGTTGTGNELNNILTGNTGANSVDGGAGNDTLIGGLGNDTLKGGTGNDTYLFNRGDGQDKISENDVAVGNADLLLFGGSINPMDLVLSRQVNDLRVSVHGTTDQVTIQNWYLGTANQVETIQAGNGQHLLNNQVQQLIQAMASFTTQTGLTWDQGIAQRPQEVQPILAANWQ